MEKYEFVRDIGSGSFGVARLMWNKETKELAAVKFIERGHKINENVAQEIANHRSLMHPNIVRFKEVLLTPTHLGIVMEYAAGGELSQYVSGAPRGRLSEDEARYFFQQLISGISYCHSMINMWIEFTIYVWIKQVSHGDLKLENTLLDGSPAAGLKICDLGFSVSSLLHSRRQSAAGTPVYMAPEVLVNGECDGKLADVWSCGVILYVMLVGAYPFDDNEEPKSFQKIVQQILGVEYKIPNYIEISSDCRQMLSRIFVAEPTKRITIKEIKNHPWFLKNLPQELTVAYQARYHSRNLRSLQSLEEMMIIVSEAKKPKLDTLSVSRDTGVAKPEKDVDPTMSRLRLPEKSIVLPNQLQSRYLNPSTSQMRWAATTSIDPLDSQYSTQAAPAYYPTISDVRLAERSIVDPDGLHSWNLDPSASQLKTAESSIVDSENLDSLYSAQTKTLYDVSMSDVHPAERSADLYY